MKYFEQTGMKYWDAFDQRVEETIQAIQNNKIPLLRRLSIHITEKCNMACSYCNEIKKRETLPKELAFKLIREFSEMGGGIVHITGGEPTTVNYLEDLILFQNEFHNINFHLNSNFYNISKIENVLSLIKRIKVSLDTHLPEKFNNTVQRKDAFNKVISNLLLLHNQIEDKNLGCIISITNTITRKNYKDIPEFLQMYYRLFPKFYAVFFSSYKGHNKEYEFTNEEREELFNSIVPEMQHIMSQNNDDESRLLFKYSHEPKTFAQNNRFPENNQIPCYIQLSELIINSKGDLYNCSHLFRDNQSSFTDLNIKDKHLKDLHIEAKTKISNYPLSKNCLYGCNKKLITFNREVQKRIL